MARYLALDWDHGQLHVVSANLGRGGAQIQQAMFWQQDQNPNPTEAEALGRVLRQRLNEAGIAPAPVLVSVGRDRVILKDIRYPAVPASEEGAVVRFQASKELTYAAEDVVIDYTPAGDPVAGAERRVLALVMRKELLTTYQELCRAAGLKLAGVTPRPFGIAACVQRSAGALVLTPAPSSPDVAVAVLTVTGRWAEFCVVRGGGLLFTRALAAGPGLLADIRRNLALYAGQPHLVTARDRVQALYVAGNGEHAVLREQLQEMLAIPVHPLDPFAGLERLELNGQRGGFTGAVGLLHAQADPRGLPINFVRTRGSAPARDPNRQRHILAGVLSVVALLGIFLVCNKVLALRQDSINELQGKLTDLDIRLEVLNKESEKLDELQGWTGGAVSWLDELADLSHRFPEARLVRLRELSGGLKETAVAGLPGKPPVKKTTALLSLSGEFSGDEQEVNRLVDRLGLDSANSRYRVVAKTILPSDEKAKTPGKLQTTIDVEKRTPEKVPARRGANVTGQAPGRRVP